MCSLQLVLRSAAIGMRAAIGTRALRCTEAMRCFPCCFIQAEPDQRLVIGSAFSPRQLQLGTQAVHIVSKTVTAHSHWAGSQTVTAHTHWAGTLRTDGRRLGRARPPRLRGS